MANSVDYAPKRGVYAVIEASNSSDTIGNIISAINGEKVSVHSSFDSASVYLQEKGDSRFHDGNKEPIIIYEDGSITIFDHPYAISIANRIHSL